MSLFLLIMKNLVSKRTFILTKVRVNVNRNLLCAEPLFCVEWDLASLWLKTYSGLTVNMTRLSSASVFQMSLSGCVSTLGPAAVPVRWRTATWRLFAARRSRRCDLTALNLSTWSLDTPRPTKVSERRSIDCFVLKQKQQLFAAFLASFNFNWVFFGFGTVGWTKQVITRCHLGLWEIATGSFHNFLTFWGLNDLKNCWKNIKIIISCSPDSNNEMLVSVSAMLH